MAIQTHLLSEKKPSVLDAVFSNPDKVWSLSDNDLLDVAQGHPPVKLLRYKPWIDAKGEHAKNLLSYNNNYIFNCMDLLDLHLELKVSQESSLFTVLIVCKLSDNVLSQVPKQDEQFGCGRWWRNLQV